MSTAVIAEWCRLHRHDPIEHQHQSLVRKLIGHDAYYGITGNVPALQRFTGPTRKCGGRGSTGGADEPEWAGSDSTD